MALLLSLLGLACLGFVTWLTADGFRAMHARHALAVANTPLRLRVTARVEIGDSLLCLHLSAPTPKGTLPAFEAGQHLLFQAPAGKAGKTIHRAYSLAAWRAKPTHYELGIKRESQGAMTPWLWHHLRVGDVITTSRPQGHFTLPRSKRPLVLIGGGIGITPMRAMLHQALAQHRNTILFQAARTVDQLLYRDECEQLQNNHPSFRYVPIVSRPGPPPWPHLTGRLTAATVLQHTACGTAAEFCLCAADAMMTELRNDLLAAGVNEGQIHWEAFGVSAVNGKAGLDIAMTRHGLTYQFKTEGAPTLLAELESKSINLPSECRAGSCGQCLLNLDAGEVDWLTEPEFTVPHGKILPCVCTPRTALTTSTD